MRKQLETIGIVIGIIASLIAIFVFISGRTSLLNFGGSTTSASIPVYASTPVYVSTPTQITTYPRLKQIYTGVFTYGSTGQSYPLTLKILSEDKQGNINLDEIYSDGVVVLCSGKVTTSNDFTLDCKKDTFSATVRGTIFPDGHIEATELTDLNDTTYWNVSPAQS